MNEELNEAKELIETHLDESSDKELTATDLAQQLKTIKQHDEDLYSSYLEQLDPESLGDVAMELPESLLKDVIETLPSKKIVEAIEELESDDATDLLQSIEEIDKNKATELFNKLDKDDQNEISLLRKYDDDEAGAHMQIELFWARKDEVTEEVVSRLRRLKDEGELENVSQLFIVNRDRTLKFVIPLEELILFDFSKTLAENMQKRDSEKFTPHFAKDSDDIQDVVSMVQDHDLMVIPIVDDKGVLLGRITADDVHDFIEESATEQIYSMAGVDDDAEEESTLVGAGKARAFWLLINLTTAIISSTIVGLFDETIASYVALAVLMPIVASMGGNTGTQALAVTVRRISLGEIEFKDAKRVLQREVSISLINGLIFGFVMGVIAWIWFAKPLLGVVIATSMLINLCLAGFFGTIIPLTLKKFDIDPAVGSSVVLTTFTDCIGFFSFLGLAKWILL
ncbi:MAG: magnesium transporter [Campylobacter sp.]|nr:magnesium transporter [Campylobacter sp.]